MNEKRKQKKEKFWMKVRDGKYERWTEKKSKKILVEETSNNHIPPVLEKSSVTSQ